MSPEGGPNNTFRISPSSSNLTSLTPGGAVEEVSLIMRVQTDTLFVYRVDVVSFAPMALEEEVGDTAS
jgi:hypothetical protein